MLRNRQQLLLTLLLICICLLLPARAKGMTYGDISVYSKTSTLPSVSHHGYIQYDFVAANTSATEDHVVKIELPGRHINYGGDVISSISRSIVLAPNTSATISLFQPPVPGSGTDASVYIDGRLQKEYLSCVFSNDHGSTGRYGIYAPSLLVSREVNRDTLDRTIQDTWGHDPTGHRFAGPGDIKTTKMNYSVSEWSENWLGYSAFDSIVVTSGELESAKPGVRQALCDYVNAGGSLTVAGEWKPDANWQIADEFEQKQRFLTDHLRIANVGFGSIAIFTDPQPFAAENISQELGQLRREVWDKSKPPIFANSVIDAHSQFPVVDNMSIPVRGLFALILLFAVVIGPANLFVLSRKKRRIYMLWTVPVLSVAGSLAVVLYATFAEGWQGSARIETVTCFDQTAKRASTIGVAGYYSPTTPGDGLHFGLGSELTPVGLQDRFRGGRSRTVEWSDDQHFKSGWITARIPAHFQLRKVQSSALRVTVEQKDDKIVAGNSLGADIKELWYADLAGQVYVASNIEAGQNMVLERDPNLSTASATMDSLRNLHETRWVNAVEKVVNSPHEYLWTHSYVAIVQSPVFVEPALANLKSSKHREIIIGTLKKGPDGN